MKKIGLIAVLFLIVLSSFSFVSAIEIKLTKDAYYPLETLQVEIEDIFTQVLTKDNIAVYEGNNVHESPVESGIIKSGDVYLYYATLPENTGNYSLRIENTKYYSGTKELSDSINKNFTIIASNESYLRINPGNIYSSKDFTIKIKAFNKAQTIDAEFLATGQKQTVSIPINSEKTLTFSISGISGLTKSEVKIGSYSIPVIIQGSQNQTNATVIELLDMEDLIRVDSKDAENVRDIKLNVLPNKDYILELEIMNKTNKTIESLNLSSPAKEIKFNPKSIDELREKQKVTLTINTDKIIDSWIKISNDDDFILLSIFVDLTNNQSKIGEQISTADSYKTCAERKGSKCNVTRSEKCSTTNVQGVDGWCCLGTCSGPSSSSTWLWGVLILLILAGVGFYIYKKSKNNLSQSDKEFFKEKADKYKERLSPPIKEGVEVRKGLAKE